VAVVQVVQTRVELQDKLVLVVEVVLPVVVVADLLDK